MKKPTRHTPTLVTSLFIFFCSVSYSFSSASAILDSTNLIQNSSFEANNQPSLQSWDVDTTLRQFVQDTPPLGGQWSVRLIPGWIPQEGFAQTYVSGQSGIGVYQLTVWIKSVGGWKGSVSFGPWTQKGWVRSKTTYSDSTAWIQISIVDTISLKSTDTIAIHISAGRAELAKGSVLFDLVRLERIQTITKVGRKDNSTPAKFALKQNYPNPFNPSTSIEYQIPANGFVTLRVFDLVGREVRTLVDGLQNAGTYRVNFEASELWSGMYFYTLEYRGYKTAKKMLLIK